MDADALPDSGSYVLMHRLRGNKCTKRCDGPFLCIGYNKGVTIALLESADGKRWTENGQHISPFRVPGGQAARTPPQRPQQGGEPSPPPRPSP